MPRTTCVIDIRLANALNQFLYRAGFHKVAYKKLNLRCPECGEPVKPRLRSKAKDRAAHFAHLSPTKCLGRSPWEITPAP